MARFDADEDQHLSFWEFNGIFLPLHGRNEIESRSQLSKISKCGVDLIRAFIDKVISMEHTQSCRNAKFPVEPAFVWQSLDKSGHGFVTYRDFE